MPTNFGSINLNTQPSLSGLPPELALKAAQIQRRQQIAAALALGSMRPLQSQTAGKRVLPISPFQGLAQVGTAWLAGRGLEEGDKAYGELGKEYQSGLQQAVQNYLTQKNGGMQPTSDELNAGEAVGTGETMQPGNPREALIGAMTSPYPQLQSLGQLEYKTSADMAKHMTPSGSAMLQEGGRDRRWATPSANVLTQEEGAWNRHAVPSGSAALSAGTSRTNTADRIAAEKEIAEKNREAAAERVRMQQTGATQRTNLAATAAAARQKYGIDMTAWVAAEKERGKGVAQARLDLPQAVSTAERALDQIDQMVGTGDTPSPSGKTYKEHPGMRQAVGLSLRKPLMFAPGADAASFVVRLKQVLGKGFLEAYESLRGGGHISDVEGEKGTQAITRMSTTQSPTEFIEAARELQEILRVGVANARRKAATPLREPAAGGVQLPPGWKVETE